MERAGPSGHIAGSMFHGSDILSVQKNVAAFSFQKAVGQLEDRTLSAAADTDNGNKLLGFHSKGKIVNDIEILAVILKGYMLKF